MYPPSASIAGRAAVGNSGISSLFGIVVVAADYGLSPTLMPNWLSHSAVVRLELCNKFFKL